MLTWRECAIHVLRDQLFFFVWPKKRAIFHLCSTVVFFLFLAVCDWHVARSCDWLPRLAGVTGPKALHAGAGGLHGARRAAQGKTTTTTTKKNNNNKKQLLSL